jgi:DNA topoisomerase VI subunit B
MQTLNRETFEISRELEFFSEKELQMQIGHHRQLWPLALVKELVDNSLDACEAANVVPRIEVNIGSNYVSVRDNGSGLLEKTLVRSLDYLIRVSDKSFYVSPTRGQLGNALKLVWAAPFVAHGDRGCVEVRSLGLHHTVEVSVDHLTQRPTIKHKEEKDAFVKKGTFVKIHWPDLACSKANEFYEERERDSDVPTMVHRLVEGYAAFNPHATFIIGKTTFKATDRHWKKWNANDPTSPHWYTPETLRDLVAAYVSREQIGGKARTVREFVSEFRGLAGTAKQKQITGGLAGVYLHDLVKDGDIDMGRLGKLLEAMKAHSKAPEPSALGIIGKEHLENWMVRNADVARNSVRYARRLGRDGLPHVIEVAFGVRNDGNRRIVSGLNWSPTLVLPTEEMTNLLGQMRIDRHDPVTVVLHIARPRFEFVDRGKTRLEL